MKLRHLILFTLPVMSYLLQTCIARVLFRRPSSYNTFMRQINAHYEKAKVETLGDIFKRHVQQLRHTPNRKVELVFLIDSSSTVGKFYFYEEVRFVKNLLADFTVDINSSRVSVITFSSPDRIFRHIDYMTQPDKDNHKCRLLIEDIPHVDYFPGGTHTLGAFLEAENVLQSARPDASKVIFLMTDGYSNGGDPRPVANRLKKQGVKIFTFGIRDGFVWELQDMASEPKNETCYILDSFEEFEALAKRALHADLQSGTHIEQPMSKCNKLCTTGGNCCHENSTCSCGTYTGKYECLCKPGYYGTGRGKTGCKPCPPGTYKNFTGLGDSDLCSPCPDEHQVTSSGAVSAQECVCKRGYHSFGSNECIVFRCPELSPPKYGYFVNNQCNNVFNAACGLRCQHGYELRGSSLRICQDDGTWSGQDAECIMKTCPSLPAPKNGHMICSSDDFSYSSVCRFTCDTGYQLLGSRKRTCLAIAYWTGIPTRCREMTCSPLVEIKDGTITPSSCTAREVVFGSTCQISCSSGYTLKGPSTKQCTPEGSWLPVENGVNQCVDETPPVLHCPENIEVTADEFEATTEVKWTKPVPVDNSGFLPLLISDPVVNPGSRFTISTIVITYKAEDLSQNVAKCKFLITVTDKTPPTIDKCNSPSPIISKTEATLVVLDPPLFSDNSGKPVEVVSSHREGTLFPWGTTTVTYVAFDSSNNNATCSVEVVLIPHLCVLPESPVNGNMSCEEGEIGVLCLISCNEGYAFAIPPAEEYFCAYEDGKWLPEDKFPFPDCAVIQISNDILQPATITLTGDLTCQDKVLIHRIEEDLEATVKTKLTEACSNDLTCSVGSLKSVCEEEDAAYNRIQLVPENKRRKRSIREYPEKARVRRNLMNKKSRITFGMMLEGSVNNKKQDGESTLELSESLLKMLTQLQRAAKVGNLDLRIGGRTLKFSGMFYDLDLHTYRCPEGSVLVNETCVNCPVGTFFHVIFERCEDCPKGTYQPLEGHNTCMSCPDNMSTTKPHSKSLQECKALCLPGTYSFNGLEPCETCHVGSYQSDYSANSCQSCSEGTTTHRRGSRREEDCAEICPPGYVSETGLAPCFPCPRNTYQPMFGQMDCLTCLAQGSTTFTGATSQDDCIIPADSWEMQSDSGYDQQHVSFSACFNDPCENGGTCVSTKGTFFTCQCAKGYTGFTCDTVLDLCEAKPCHNGGSCHSIPGGFQCNCKDGYTGTNCEINIDDCAISPCENKGTCIDGINSFTCNCKTGYTGPTCNSRINDCAEAPCQNGGTCINTLTSFQCQCKAGFTGTTCEINVDECLSAPCHNGGTCEDLPGTYSCACKRGYTDRNCATEINECADNPCQNGAQCEDLVDNYKCHCKTGYTGKKCEKALTSQYQLDFITPTILDYAEMSIDQPLSAATVSFWIRTGDKVNQGTPFSYAVQGEPDTFTVTNYDNLKLIVNGEERSVGISLTDNRWHHVVITWSSLRGDWKVYVDSLISDQGYNLSTAKLIPGKGTLIIGQEQDKLRGDFSSSESFIGSLTQLNMWNYELSKEDLFKLRFKCENFNGNVIAWPSVQENLKGNVKNSPSSFCQGCPTPINPLSGSVSFLSVSPGSEATYSCDTGYEMKGFSVHRCLATGDWEFLAPKCKPIECDHPGNITNGYAIGSDLTFGKKIHYQCIAYHELKGPSSLTCNEWGEWDLEKPECNEIQCNLPVLSENTVTASNSTRFLSGSTVSFSCRLGSFMQTQHNSVTCQKDGSWDKSFPTCDLVKCGSPPTIENGQPQTNNPEYNIGDIVRYTCDYTFEFNPDVSNIKSNIACLFTGEWETELPECIPIKCADPPFIPNTIANGTERSVMSVVNYTCIPGFRPQGDSLTKCQETKDWSSHKFRCVPVICKEPPAIGNGSFTGDMYIYNSVVDYKCYQGYTLVRNEARRCQENGTWSGPNPYCSPVSCGNLSDIADGNVEFGDTTFRSTVQYSCNSGFELIGFPERTCEASGIWEPEIPICQRRVCPIPEEVPFGTYQAHGRFEYNTSVDYTCNTGFQLSGEAKLTCMENGSWSSPAPKCEQIQCPPLDNPEHGSVLTIDRTYSSIAGYRCDKGFKVVGDDARTCQVDGTWSDRAPICVATKCTAPENVDNGITEYKDLSIGSIVQYSCAEGYKLSGTSMRRCQDDLTFSGSSPECLPVECGTIETFNNGNVTHSDDKAVFGVTAHFSCNEGYNLKGSDVSHCGSDGKWTGQIPECNPIQCPILTEHISHGKVNVTEATGFGTVVEYQCDEGYNVDGSHVRKCLANGEWDGSVPSCEAIECPIPQLFYGYISTSEKKYGTTVKFSCQKNYRLIGPSERTCTESGEWSGEEPKCVKIKCNVPDPGKHSQITAVNDTAISYQCASGYILVGQDIRVCQEDEVWRPEPPVCQIVTCNDLSNATLDNGAIVYTSNAFGDVVSYTCNTGFELKGEEKRHCLPVGLWNGVEPKCEIVSCQHPGALANGDVTADQLFYNSTAYFRCNKGYRLVGAQSLKCLSNKQWESGFPSCEIILCPQLQAIIPNGSVNVTSNTVSGTAVFTCLQGFQLIGNAITECLETGHWSGKEPFCAEVSCTLPESVDHAIMEGDKFGFGDAIFYTCEPGYELYGDFTRVCQQDGTWSNNPPHCLSKNCPEPGWKEHGHYEGSAGTYQSVITFKCEEGYEIIGSVERTCLANSSWSGEDPDCIRVSCGTPASIEHAVLSYMNDFLYGSRVTYSCIEGYRASGVDTTECMAQRAWKTIDFKCTIITCPSFTTDDIPHAVFNASGFTYGSTVSFACEVGYELKGSSAIICKAEGAWSAALPTCLIVQCPKLAPLEFGTVLSNSYDYNSLASFTCNIGYQLTGAQVIRCLVSGQWNESQPICQIIYCAPPDVSIPHGSLNDPKAEYVYRDTCSYSCDYGYELQGDNLLTCLETGEFDLPPPQCVKIPCPTPQNIEFGQFVLFDNDTVFYSCQAGYELTGKDMLQCLLGGAWSGLAPVCLPVVCPQPSAIDEGWIEGNEFTFQKYIQYVCNLGFQLEGDSTRVCQANRTWSGENPQCLPVSCGDPTENFKNGFIAGVYTYGDGAEYSCRQGFALEGESFRLCQANGTWAGEVPVCVRQSCAPPDTIDNRHITGDSYLFEDKITYSCVPGYELQGDAVRVCTSDLTWNGTEPACIRISCVVPIAPTNGVVTGDSYMFGDRVNVSCNFGYRLAGSDYKICQVNRLWSDDGILCRQIFCPTPPVFRNCHNNLTSEGDLYPVNYKVGYTCDRGYLMNGTGLKICQPSGQWSDDYIDCYPISCPKIEDIEHGTVIGESYIYLSILEFACNLGFRLVGNSQLQCTESGAWSDQIPHCLVIACPALDIENGYTYIFPNHVSEINITRDTRQYIYGDTITFECNPGYELSGVSTSQCLISGLWSNVNTTCTAVKCPKPLGIENSVFSESPMTYQSTLTVSCIEGYNLIGEPELTCGANRDWKEPLPRCVLLACGAPPPVSHATIEGDSFKVGETITYKCKAGFELVGNSLLTCGANNAWLGTVPICVEVDCGAPPDIAFASVTVGKTTFQSSAHVKCNLGYVLQGNGTIFCGSDRGWKTNPSMHCAPIDCGPPPDIPFASYSVENTTLGSVAFYSCEKGHFMMGTSSLFCDEEGSWVYEYPICSPVDCMEPPAIDHANYTTGGTLYLARAEYTCAEGYILRNASLTFLVCGDMGAWQGDRPECQIVDCGPPPNIQYAYYLLDNNRTDYFSFAIYHCKPGYQSLEANSYLTCDAFRRWNGTHIVCQPLDCSSPPALLNGEYISNNGTQFGAVISYNCGKGYVKTGPETIVCAESGVWSSDSHACLPVDCQAPKEVTFGNVQYDATTYLSTAVYHCSPGYKLIGTDVSHCSDSGQWSGKTPNCAPVDCKSPPLIEHGRASFSDTTFQNVATYSCSLGYVLQNSSTLTCGEKGSWVGELPVCILITCPQPVVKPHSKVMYSSLTYQSVAVFSCEVGYRLVGEASAFCTAAGNWSSEPPECSPKDCSHPIEINNGNVFISGTTFGASATYTCNTGYTLVGSDIIFCNEEGAWNSSVPRCQIISCQEPSSIADGMVLYAATTYLSLATYRCNGGFKLIGDETAVCQDSGQWVRDASMHCERITCREPPNLLNGQAVTTETTHSYGSSVTYECNSGFFITGSDKLTCGKDGTWQGDFQSCQEVTCPPLEDIPNGNVKYSSTEVGAEANYICSTGFKIEGESILTCLINGSWSGETPVCKRVSCAAPPVIANAFITADTGRNVSAQVTYSCMKGYRMINDNDNSITLTCWQDGDWHGKIPSCEIIVCYDLPPGIIHSTHTANGDTYKSLALYTCDLGYILSGNPSIMCNHEGQWATDDPPVCTPVSCGSPPIFDKAIFDGTDFTFDQSVNYTCESGYDLLGNNTTVCGADGRWSLVTLQCQVRTCNPVIAVPENGKIVLGDKTDGYIVGDVIEFSCLGNFTLIGSRTIRCSESGEWDSRSPQCLIIIDLCSESLEMDNVLPPPPGKVTGDEITVQCQEGYLSVGDMKSVCQQGGVWSLPQGKCEKVFCGKPKVENAQNVVLMGHSFNYGDTVIFMCRFGYTPVQSPPILRCLHTEKWDRKPECIAHCKQECLNGGFCIGANRCKCMPGWAGSYCQSAVCILPCFHGGQCVAPYKCQCPAGYEGSRCQQAKCAASCENGGRCLWPNKCQCPAEFYGTFCNKSKPGYQRRQNLT